MQQSAEINITDYIPIGHENAISRRDLARMTGLGDRQMRHCIKMARRETPILNLQDGAGYFRPDASDETDKMLLRAFVKQEESRGKAIMWALKATRKALKAMGD